MVAQPQSPRREPREETQKTSIVNKKQPSGDRPKRQREYFSVAHNAPTQPNPAKKRRRLHKHNEGNEGNHSSEETLKIVIEPAKTVAIIPDKALSLTGKIGKGQASWISRNKVLVYNDLPAEAYELSALLRHNTSYELIAFLAWVQVAVVACMAEKHAKQQMVQRALARELESDEEHVL